MIALFCFSLFFFIIYLQKIHSHMMKEYCQSMNFLQTFSHLEKLYIKYKAEIVRVDTIVHSFIN